LRIAAEQHHGAHGRECADYLPPWHEDALRQTTARYEAAQEQPVDWAAAKCELRKRAE
jgi:hypothetical protein